MLFAPTKPSPIAKKLTGNIVPFGIPNKGINARDPLVAMPPGFAFNLVNAVPEQYGIRTRKGYIEWESAIGADTGPVHSMMAYYPAGVAPAAMSAMSAMSPMARMFLSGPSLLTSFGGKLFAARGTGVYDVTAGGDGSLLVPETGVAGADAYWISFMFQNVGGAYLIAVNDGTGYAYYDGAAWNTPAMGAGVGEIDNVNPALFVHACEFKKRLWFVEGGSTSAWYLDTSAITGPATEFDFGEQFNRGGHLVALANWTVDAGEGVDDYLIAVGSQGDVVVYKGTDPDTPATFALHGVWQVGPLPLGRRSVTQRAGDVHILSQMGVTAVSKLLALKDQLNVQQISASYYIDPIVSRLMHDYSNNEGWQLVDIPREEMALIGVPVVVYDLGVEFFGLKITTSGWFIIKDTTYTSFVCCDAVVFAGTTDGRVVIAFNGVLDNVIEGESVGVPIVCELTPAYQPLGTPGHDKRILLMRPMLLAAVKPLIKFTILLNYEPPDPLLIPTLPVFDSSLWDTALWDEGIWTGLLSPIHKWLGARGEGTAATPQIMYVCVGDTMITSIDLWVEQGGVL